MEAPSAGSGSGPRSAGRAPRRSARARPAGRGARSSGSPSGPPASPRPPRGPPRGPPGEEAAADFRRHQPGVEVAPREAGHLADDLRVRRAGPGPEVLHPPSERSQARHEPQAGRRGSRAGARDREGQRMEIHHADPNIVLIGEGGRSIQASSSARGDRRRSPDSDGGTSVCKAEGRRTRSPSYPDRSRISSNPT